MTKDQILNIKARIMLGGYKKCGDHYHGKHESVVRIGDEFVRITYELPRQDRTVQIVEDFEDACEQIRRFDPGTCYDRKTA